jgi:serine/threonine protein kinase/Tfp pilus assembly protein PilF
MICPSCRHRNPADTRFCGRCGAPLKKAGKRKAGATRTLRIPSRELAIGAEFAGRYHVIEDLGKGGMGHVYKVLDQEIKEVVALKILKPGALEDEGAIERFHNELKLARRVSHKNVCGLYHLSKDENDTYYITMEYVSGEDLKNLIRRVGQLTIGKAVSIANQICEGLAEAHRLGIIHRDLKPHNVMIDRDGHVRIMDFGIARSLSSKGLTDPHAIIGTPDYMSPEQMESKETDHRTDIYSLGVILYEMLTGHLPFEGKSLVAIALKQKTQSPVSPKKFNPHVPDSLCRVVLKCLEKKKEKRFEGVQALRDELAGIERALNAATSAPAKGGKTRQITQVIRGNLRWKPLALAALALAALFLVLNRAARVNSQSYDNYISMEIAGSGPARALQKPVEFVLNRAVSSSTKSYVFVQDDLLTYKKRTRDRDSASLPAVLSITGEIIPRVVGFDISLTTRFRGRSDRRTFDCKGIMDFLTSRADDLVAYLSDLSEGLVARPEGGAKIAAVCTSSIDSLEHFLKGDESWGRLDSETACYEYITALENDPSFGLPHLRLVDVYQFRGDHGAARKYLELALSRQDRLTDLDLLRLYALKARLESKPNEERQFLGKLTEEFPFKKEYHYEFAESYFHCGAPEEAIPHYLRALELDGRYSLALNHLAYCYSWMGEHEKAVKHFLEYQALDPSANSYDSLATGYMFAGDCEQALAVLRDGLEVNPGLDYFYTNMARNHLLLGQLGEARDAILRQEVVTTREFTRTNIGFWRAFIEFSRGHESEARKFLAPALDAYRQDTYRDRLEEYQNAPFWLAGVLAARSGDGEGLRREIEWLEDKIRRHSVSATNFFPILKFHIHLSLLAGMLDRDDVRIHRCIEEGRQIGTKMGYRSSLFNLPWFFNLYAEALMETTGPARSRALSEAKALLEESNAYNPRYARTRLNLANLFLEKGDTESARSEHALAKELLSAADPDYVLVGALKEIGARLVK